MKFIAPLLLTLVLCFQVSHANEFPIWQHLKDLENMESKLINKEYSDQSETKALFELQNQIDQYAKNLAFYFEEKLEKKRNILPYELNLVHETLRVQMLIHSQIIQKLENRKKLTLDELALAISQIEGFKETHDLFYHRKTFRSFIYDQSSIPNYGIQNLEKTINSVMSAKRIKKIETHLRVSIEKVQRVDGSNILNRFLKDSQSLKLVMKDKSLSRYSKRSLFFRSVGDGTSGAIGSVATGLSFAFGNVAGSISWREGFMKENTNVMAYLTKNLKPFDLLFEKKAFKLTDKTIPGHWGHVGVYLGTKKQLKELGLWNSKRLLPYQSYIEEGKVIFQVRRWGLVFDSLQDFINLDEMAVLRIPEMTKKTAWENDLILKNLFAQIGKKYDYSFDAMTTSTITCTEIIALSYGPINWPMKPILGRKALSPDDMVALTFYHNSPIQFITYISADEKGEHFHTKEEFASKVRFTKNEKSEGAEYLQLVEKCDRKAYRHRRQGIRFKYECYDITQEKSYHP